MDARFFSDFDEMHAWLEANHEGADELWVGLYKKGASKSGIGLTDAQDAGMCFGWVDSLGRRIDEERWRVRFTPRRAKSSWTDDNVRRARDLEKRGLMRQSGLDALARRSR